MKLTFTNNFHGSDVTVRLRSDGTLSKWQVDRVYRVLCGLSGCACGGIRGRQWVNDGDEIDMDYGLHSSTPLYRIHHHRDGSLERLPIITS